MKESFRFYVKAVVLSGRSPTNVLWQGSGTKRVRYSVSQGLIRICKGSKDGAGWFCPNLNFWSR